MTTRKLLIRTLLLTCILGFAINAQGQKKLLEKLTSNSADTTRSASFLPIPAIGYAQETGWEFGLVTIYSFYTDRKDTLTRSSTLSAAATFTTKKQSNFLIRNDIWTPQNKYHHLEEIRYKNFPFYYYGVGNQTLAADKELLNQKMFKLKGELQKRLGKASYTGINVNFENYSYSVINNSGTQTPGSKIQGGKVAFAGISQTFDNRNINTYTTKGLYVNLNYSYAPNLFGKDNFTGSLLKLNVRQFTPLSKKLVLALNANYESLFGNSHPFYLLRQLGNDELMRGYYSGRYRDANYIAAQGELRYRFLPRLGIVGFAGQGSVYKKNGFKVSDLKPSYGGGLRYFFDVDRGLSIRVDYGIGEKPANEKRQKGMYISLAEAF